ncbi:hypothetical protein FD04_GL000600 [Secundilactobacillus odoratitofui DSM 19909 = JCM 15043]|uniref:Integral membrane protein n=1 Tax=Secundilactobacillus odoratitofui DSM 19909 = JCM 15043 TaxID=1423776 RepID=A0A0R1M2U4_9LACO|nr:hypothetical protein [Secundilactobacillus odoratitofui]KRK98858.1 hypothetical protein FD04_GL000600 [Secundilactobacillus odoratitofui DSM 19909 = JCM 15043]
MLKQKLITFGIVSWVLFSVINLLMSSKFIALGQNVQTGDVMKSILISLILYAVPMIIGALGKNAGYYVLAIVIVIYSFGMFAGMVTVLTASHADMGVKAVMSLANLLVIVFNGYWLVLALRYRKWLDRRRDEKLYQKLNQQKANQTK